jgi:hypothetical protein
MSQTNLAIAYFFIVILGITGVWFASVAVDSGDFRGWLGFTLLLGAAVGLVIVYQRDLRPSLQEKRIEWQRIKAKGKVRYVLAQILWTQVVWLPIFLGGLLEIYKNGTWGLHSLPPWWWVVLALLGAPFALVYSVVWWGRQEQKYSDAH